jgi:glycosyltransferase involved in cell wall biosynthesis
VNTPAVSILVPTYNCARYLPVLCESIQRQTLGDFEALLWDDGSTDNTAEVVAPFLKDARFRLLRSAKNDGLNASWRGLLGQARGEFWCSPGADDVLFPDFLERRVAKLRSAPDAALIHGRPVYIDATGQELKEKLPEVHPDPVQRGDDALLALVEHNYINQPSVLARTVTTKRVLPHWSDNWKYAPDWHLWILHAATGQPFLYDAVPAHQYRIHEASISGDPGGKATRMAEVRLVPLCALAEAQTLSRAATDYWTRWRSRLYALWLWRALKVRRMNQLNPTWLDLATHAFYGSKKGTWSFRDECIRYALHIVVVSFWERRAKQRNSFAVAGLAQIGHPLFR